MGQRGQVCFLRFSKRKGVADSDPYYFKDKGSIKITSKLEALGRTLLSGAIGWILAKFAYFTCISGPHVAPKENSLKKIYRSEFLQSSFIFVMHLLNEVYRKIMSEIHFVGKLDMRILQRLALNTGNFFFFSSYSLIRMLLNVSGTDFNFFVIRVDLWAVLQEPLSTT